MRTFICVLLLSMSIGGIWHAVDTENRAARWERYTTSAKSMEEVNSKIAQSQEYSKHLLSVLGTMATENGVLCERDAQTMQVVREFEEANQKLKSSLSEAVARLEEMTEQVNDLMDENDSLYYKIGILERALEVIENSDEPETVIFPGPEFEPVIIPPIIINEENHAVQ